MARVISIANQKGGVGKTTTAVNLSACLAQKGKRVLLIDIDPQGNATSGLGIEAHKDKSVYNVLVDDMSMAETIEPTMIKKLDVTFYQIDAFNGNIPSIQISNEIFYTTLALINPYTKLPYYDDTIYDIEVVYHSQIKKGINLVDEIDPEIQQIEPCKVSNFGSNYQNLFENKQVELSQCVPKYNKLLRGHRTYDYYSYYEINFYPCINTTENNFKCKDYITLYRYLT